MSTKTNLKLKKLSLNNIDQITRLATQLNPSLKQNLIEQRIIEMFKIDNYYCFGCFKQDQLIGISSGWITVRIYSGKQLEIDNVIIDYKYQSQGYGEQFIQLLEAWAKENTCETLELNAYVENSRAHKFYFKQDYKVLGFHFQKKLE